MQSLQRSPFWKLVAPLLALVLLAAACGDDGGDFQDLLQSADQSNVSTDDDLDAELEEFGEVLNQVLGAGGGGTLVFDGVEYPIDSVICSEVGDRIEAGTTSESGFRVLVSGKPGDLSPQILDPDFRQWFDGDKIDPATRDLVSYDGQVFTAPTNSWWNNQDDRFVQASFTFTCP